MVFLTDGVLHEPTKYLSDMIDIIKHQESLIYNIFQFEVCTSLYRLHFFINTVFKKKKQ